MKKIKIERTDKETGVEEVVALDATIGSNVSPIHLETRQELDEEEELLVGCPKKLKLEEDSVIEEQLEQPTSYETTTTTISDVNKIASTTSTNNLASIDSQQTINQQQQRQQFPELQRALPSGIPANYCTYCNKELCNKYFMKTHMQKMHGINLDDCPREAANSGGVVCDICQKELCSKYFLKVHKSNTHGITDFTGNSAGSQAANAATAVAAIALTNYSLNHAQNRAALNLALNRQLQSRQAAALMNAAAASAAFNPLQVAQAARAAATHQRDQLTATNLIGHLQQRHPQQSQQQLVSNKSQPQQLDLHQAPLNQTTPTRTPATDLQTAFPAALLAATAGPTLLAAQMVQQQQQQQQQHHFPSFNNQSQNRQTGQGQQQPHSNHASPFYSATNEDPLDTGEDSSDTDSQNSEEQQKNPPSAMNNFQQVQSQQALLNAAAVFNPAAAAAAMLAMQQQQQQQQQQHQQRLQQQQQQQQQQQLSMGSRQQTAMDLRNQSNSQHSHYTEACPICDRRFKSIKWLQSHVMNDHKNEISNLFSLLVQMMLISGGGNGASNGNNTNGGGNQNASPLGTLNDSGSPNSNGILNIDWQQVVMQQQQQQQQQQQEQVSASAAAANSVSNASRGDV